MISTTLLMDSGRNDDFVESDAIQSNRLTRFLKQRLSNAKMITTAELQERLQSMDSCCIVKTLLWQCNGYPFMLVLDVGRQVDKSLLSSYLMVDNEELGLCSREKAMMLSGFKIGTISPIGVAHPMRMIVDAALIKPDVDKNDVILFCGGGEIGQELEITLNEFLRLATNAEIAMISKVDDNNVTEDINKDTNKEIGLLSFNTMILRMILLTS